VRTHFRVSAGRPPLLQDSKETIQSARENYPKVIQQNMGFDSGCLTLGKEAVIIYSHMAISEAGLGRVRSPRPLIV